MTCTECNEVTAYRDIKGHLHTSKELCKSSNYNIRERYLRQEIEDIILSSFSKKNPYVECHYYGRGDRVLYREGLEAAAFLLYKDKNLFKKLYDLLKDKHEL
jgi:hypothetical protein